MSGGSYNYLYMKLEDEDWRDSIEELRNMEARLRASGYDMPADRILKFIDCYSMTNKMLRNRAEDIIELAKVVEWVDSCDWCEEDLLNWIADQGVVS